MVSTNTFRVNAKDENSVQYVRIVSRANGLTLYAEKGFNEEIHSSQRIEKPRYLVGMTAEEYCDENGLRGDSPDFRFSNLQAWLCGELVIVPKDFAEKFQLLTDDSNNKKSRSDFVRIFQMFKKKFDSNQDLVELSAWWEAMAGIWNLEPDFPSDDVPFMAKDLGVVLEAVKLKHNLKDAEKAERKKRKLAGLVADSDAVRESAIARVLGEDHKVLEAFNNSKSPASQGRAIEHPNYTPLTEIVGSVAAGKSVATVQKAPLKLFSTLGEQDSDTKFTNNVSLQSSGHGFSVYVENKEDDSEDTHIPYYFLKTGDSEKVVKTNLDRQVLDKEIGLFNRLPLIIFLTSVFNLLMFAIFGVIASLGFLVLIAEVYTAISLKQKIDEEEKFHNWIISTKTQNVHPVHMEDAIVITERLAQSIRFLNDGNASYSGYLTILRTLKEKIETNQGAQEIESWLTAVDSISRMDESFPVENIPAMSVDAAEIREIIERKVVADRLELESNAAVEARLASEKNDTMVEFMKQDSEAAKEGALVLLGVREVNAGGFHE